MRKFKKKNITGGFTLIETVVAVAILSMAVAGPLTLAVKNIGSATVSQDQIIAFYLAQEGTEFVRNKIDENILNDNVRDGDGWLYGLEDCFVDSFDDVDNFGCYVEINKNDPVESCLVLECDSAKLKFNEDSDYYTSDGAKGLAFKRIIKIVGDNNSDEAKIKATVSWEGKRGYSFTMYDNIYNWRK